MRMKKHTQHLIAEIPGRSSSVGTTIGIDLGDIWSHYCTLNEDGEVVDRGRFRTNPSGVDKRFRDLEPMRIAMEAGTHSIWISEQIEELGHEVIVANVRELRAISHSDRKCDKVDAEKLARYARLDPEILRPIAHRTVAQQETLTLIRARDVLALANRRGELGPGSGQALRVPAAGFIHTCLREALSRSAAAGSVGCAQPPAPADRGHDGEDQAI
jgi:transposase